MTADSVSKNSAKVAMNCSSVTVDVGDPRAEATAAFFMMSLNCVMSAGLD